MKEETETETLNISELAKRFSLTRSTIVTRIEAAGIEPVFKKSREKIYEMGDALEAALTKKDPELERLKKRKLAAEAEGKEIQVAEKKGEMLSTSEVREAITQIFGNLFREFMRTHKRIGARLAKAKTAGQAVQILQEEDMKIFNRLRTNYAQFLDKPSAAKGKG